MCTALCVHRRSYYAYGSLRSTRGPAPAPPLNNKTPALLSTAFCVPRLVCAPPCARGGPGGGAQTGGGGGAELSYTIYIYMYILLLRLNPTVSLLCVYRFWLHFIVHSLFGNVPGCLFGHTLYSSHQVIDIYDVHNLHHYPTLCRLVPLSCVRARTSVLALVHAFLLSKDLFKQQLGLCSLAPLGWQYWSKAPTKAPTKAVDYLC